MTLERESIKFKLVCLADALVWPCACLGALGGPQLVLGAAKFCRLKIK